MDKRTALARMIILMTSVPILVGCSITRHEADTLAIGPTPPPTNVIATASLSGGMSPSSPENGAIRQASHDLTTEIANQTPAHHESRTELSSIERSVSAFPFAGTVKLAQAPDYDEVSPSDLVLANQTETEPNALLAPVTTRSEMSLADFESLAFANNPTLSQLAASTQKAAGYRNQVRLRPNPTAGYQAVQLADAGTDQHTLFVEQEFVTGKKLQANYAVLNETLRAQLLDLDTQRERLATDVRVKFYAVLLTQARLDLIEEFRSVTAQGVEIAKLRLDAQEGSRIDLLQSQIQQNEIALMRRQAEIARAAAWQELAAFAGVPDLPLTRAVGELPVETSEQSWDALAMELVSQSPEYQAAQARISRARMDLHRQGIQPLPNVTMQLAAGIDKGTDSGLINLQIGAPLPVFNKNQGNIAAARAEYCRAVMDAQRIENSIRARLALISGDYDQALAAVQVYSDQILPSARESLDLAEVAYKSGETSFLQVLQARRTFFEANLQFVDARASLAQAKVKVDGYLLEGALDPVTDDSGDDGLRDRTFSQQ